MLILDVNIVVAAFRADHPNHKALRAWFDTTVTEPSEFGVPDLIWGSFLRIVTNRRIFDVPTPRDQAFAFIDATVAQPGYLPANPGPRHLLLLKRLCEEGDVSGDLVPDAILAAVAVEHGATVISLDRDFARFGSVKHLRPGNSS